MQPALLSGHGMRTHQLRWRLAAELGATGWPTPRSQAPPQHWPRGRLSLEERGETPTRFWFLSACPINKMTGFEWAYYSTKDMEMLSNKNVEVFVLRPLNSVVVPHEKGGPKAAPSSRRAAFRLFPRR
jgi:hypothetical protein